MRIDHRCESSPFQTFQLDLRTAIETKVDEVLRDCAVVNKKSSEIYANVVQPAFSWRTLKKCLNKVIAQIAYYETKEATTIFELALWKFRIDRRK